MTAPRGSIEDVCVNTIRTLCIDAVQQAKSGHPGTPMAMAPVVYTLWQDFLRFDPDDPIWPNRDRFVLSSGHASTLLYSMLHLTGVTAVDEKYERLGTPTVSLDDLKHFRQLDSKCPGHPEYHLTSGIETTTGPLGQGIATSVGMAIAADWLARYFNRPDFKLFDYDVFALCGDGCMMEGVSSEAASLAGHLKLGNLCWIYDSNHITIEGNTALAFSEDVAGRFLAYGWHVQRVSDANDRERIAEAIAIAKRIDDRPSLIIVTSHIGYGAPHKQDTSGAHGEPLGDEEVKLTKRAYGWPEDAEVPRAGRRLRAFRGEFRRPREKAARRMDGALRALPERIPRAGRPMRANAAARSPRRLGPRHPGLLRRSQGDRQPRLVEPGAERDRAASAVAARRSGRSRALDQDPAHFRRMPANSRRRTTPGEIFISASASTRWARSATASRCRNCARTAPAF